MTYKILGMSDSLLISTGYSNQMRYLFKYLGDKPSKWDLTHISWHYFGMPIKNVTFEDGDCLKNVTIKASGQHTWGADVLQKYINEIRPEIFITLADSFMFVQEQPFGRINNWITSINFSPAKSILYFPSDGEPFPQGCDVALRKFNHCVAMSKFAQKQVMDQYGISVEYIPHCVDTNIFYKMKNKQELKKKWSNYTINSLNQQIDLTNKKIVLCVARNQPRKFMDRMIKLAKEYFKDGKNKDTIFLFKSEPNDPASGGVDLITMAREAEIADKICWISCGWFSGLTIHEMREIYNLADVFCCLTSGEGWMIPLTESLSCEIPVLVTRFTAPIEQVDDDDRQMVRLQTSITGTFNVERGIADINDANKKLQLLMDNDILRKEIGIKNRDKVLKEYSTTVVMPKWEEYFEKVINE